MDNPSYPGPPLWNHGSSLLQYQPGSPQPWAFVQYQPYPQHPWDPNMGTPPQPVPQPPPLNRACVPFIPHSPPRVQLVEPCMPLYYVAFPAPFPVRLHGGIMWERSAPPIYRPRPVYANRKRAMPGDVAVVDVGVVETSMPDQRNENNKEQETPKKNKLETNEIKEQKKIPDGINTVPPTETFKGEDNNPPRERKRMPTNITLGDFVKPRQPPSFQVASTSNAEEQIFYVSVLNSKEPETSMKTSTGRGNCPKPKINKDDLIQLSQNSCMSSSSSPATNIGIEFHNGEAVAEKRSLENLQISELQNGSMQFKGKGGLVKPLESDKARNILLEITPNRLYEVLKSYVPSWEQLRNMGYPLATIEDTRIAIVFKQDVHMAANNYKQKQNRDKKRAFELTEKMCVRCGESFYVKGVTYLTTEECQYHWGKLKATDNFKMLRTCCYGDSMAKGCTTSKLHVWSGISEGLNHLKGFVKPPRGKDSSKNIVSIDCEMIYTKAGMEVARVVLVDVHGDVVYRALVRPQHDVIDYNTRFSGVSLDDYKEKNPKPFHDVQRELLRYIKSETIVIGHSLENDLRVLKIVHPLVVDTAVIYPHPDGFPLRRSLKDLAKEVLGKTIQTDDSGHDPVEDAKTALALVLTKVKMDYDEIDQK